MAIRYAAVSSAGAVSETLNNQATLLAAVGTANAVAGAKADITTELAAAVANQPSGAVVVSIDLASVTTKAQLRRLLDAAYNHFAATNIFS